jgi:two-component sensor histidine kinase/Tfp pilus assembly protein PilF
MVKIPKDKGINFRMKKFTKSFFFLLFTFHFLFLHGQKADSIAIVRMTLSNGNALLNTDTAKALSVIDEACSMAIRLNSKDLAAEAFRNKADILIYFDSVSTVVKYYQQSAQFFQEGNKTEEAAETNIRLGKFFCDRGYYEQSLKAYSIVLNDSVLMSDKNLDAKALLGSGIVYTQQGFLSVALKNFVTALELYQQLKNQAGIADAWHNIGIIHWKEGKNEDALVAYGKSLEIRKQISDSLGIASSYSNIGVINRIEKKYQEALNYDLLSLAIRRRHNDLKGEGQTLMNLGSLTSETGNNRQALKYYYQSLAIKEKTKDNYGKLSAYLNIADVLLQTGDKKGGEERLKTGLALAEKIGALDFIKSFHRDLSEYYSGIRDFENAYYHHVKYMEAKDSLITTTKNHDLAELQKSYDLSEKQRSIDALTQRDNLLEEKNARDRIFRNSLIAIIALVLIFVGVLINRARALKKSNIDLGEQKKLVEQREKEKETLLCEVHHRVKNNLQLTSSLLNLQARQLKDSEASQSLKDARDRIMAISLIHQKLFAKDEFESINLADYIPDLCNAIVESNSNETTKVVVSYDLSAIFIPLDESISIGLFINEAIINCLKHAFAGKTKGEIQILAKQNENKLLISIADNGVGMGNIPNPETSSGFGFRLLHSMAVKLKGELKFENENGTSISLEMPIK